MRSRPVWQHPLLWIAVVFVGLAVANSFLIPSFESMDEPEHFNFMRYVADGHGLPDQRDVETAIAYDYYQQGGQPPLYYVMGALVLRLLGTDMGDVGALTVPNPFSTCGDLTQPYSKGLWLRDPLREAWPLRGAALGVHTVRLLSAVFGLATVAGVYTTALAAFPQVRNTGVLAAALVAFNPRFLVLSATVTNDTLLTALCTWGICLGVQILRHGPCWRRSVALGALTGLAALTKVSGIFLLPFAMFALLVWAWRSRDWAGAVAHAGAIASVAVAIGGWWYLSNIIRYGDPGLVPLLTQDTGRRSAWPARLILPEIRKFYHSYWASANYCELRFGFFPVYGALSALGAAGLVVYQVRAKGAARWPTWLLLLWVLGVFLSWVAFNSMVYAPNGRYFFQANGAIGPLLAVGLLTLIEPRGCQAGGAPRGGAMRSQGSALVWRTAILLLAGLAMVTPVGILAPLYTAPPMKPIRGVSIKQPLEAVFDDRVRLVGYELGAEEVRAGQALDVTLYLSAVRPITESLALGLQMKSAGPRDETVLVNLRNWPGGGNLPTTAWVPDQVFVDHYRLLVPVDVEYLQDWELRLMFFEYPRREGEDDRLMATIGGTPGGPYVVLGYVRVEPTQVAGVPASAELHPAPAYGDEQDVVLQGAEARFPQSARLQPGIPDALRLTLWWRAQQPMEKSYTVFVHLLDSDGRLVASGDDVPRGGAMTTNRWQPGDLVVDAHFIALPAGLPVGSYRLRVGLYDADGRVPAWDGQGNPIPDGSVEIAVWTNGGK